MTDARRRRPQFSVRTLFVAVIVLSLPLSWFGVRMHKAKKYWETIQSIQRAGGIVRYDGQRFRTNFTPPPPTVWSSLIGYSSIYDVTRVEYSGRTVTAGQFLQLRELPSLGILRLHDCTIDDAGLEYVGQLGSLYELYVVSDNITDDGLVHLEKLAHVDLLEIGGGAITEQGLNRLRRARPDCYVVHVQQSSMDGSKNTPN